MSAWDCSKAGQCHCDFGGCKEDDDHNSRVLLTVEHGHWHRRQCHDRCRPPGYVRPLIRRLGLGLVVVVLVTVAGCGGQLPASVHAGSSMPVVTPRTMTPPPAAPAPSPVSSAATVTGRCVPGLEDVTEGEFWAISTHGGDGFGADDELAEAYQVKLTNAGTSTAEVTGFAVALYSQGQETTSDNQSFDSPAFITAGQSLTWTETPWGQYENGSASLGPFGAGQMGAVDASATCSMVQWYTGG